MTYTVLYVRPLNCFVMFICDLGTVTLVQMKGHVPYFGWLHGVVPGVLVAGWRSLDRISMSRMLVSRLYAISGGWLKIAANSARDYKKTPSGLDDFAYQVGGRVVQQTDNWSLLGSCFVVGLKGLLTWNGFDLLKSSSNYVFRVVSLDEEFNHLLWSFFLFFFPKSVSSDHR